MPDTSISDRIALQDVLLNYAAGVDERDKQRYSACFATDVEIVNFGAKIYHGRDAWVEYVWGALENYSATQHMLGPQFARIDGDTAITRNDVQATHFLKDDAGRFTLWATYHTQLQRIDGQWLITRHELQVCGSSQD